MTDSPTQTRLFREPSASWLSTAVLVLCVLTLGVSCRPAMGVVASDKAPRKRALIVAIGNYPAPEIYGYAVINAPNDIPLVKKALMSQGFLEEDILVVQDEQATKVGILEAFRSHLISPSQPGDIIAFHYSGHGHQLTDNNADELDGYDEVLVPYGAPGVFVPGYKGEKHIRDDDLNLVLSELRARLGPKGNVFISIDACHSGSATRGAAELPVRGVATPLGPPASDRGDSEGTVFENQEVGTRGAGADSGMAPIVVFSAAAHDELDHEVRDTDGTPVGPLSLALSRTMPNLRPGMSYAAFFEQIRLQIAGLVKAQTPQAEGDVDTEVFSGQTIERSPFFRVTEVLGDTLAVLQGGTLVGLLPGSRVAFYALDATVRDSPVAKGVVDFADEVSSEVKVAYLPEGLDLEFTRGFVTEYAYGEMQLALQLNASTPGLVAAFKDVPAVRLVQDAPDLVVSLGIDGLELWTGADHVRVGSTYRSDEPQAIQSLVAQVKDFARGRFLQQVEMRDPALNLKLSVIPATHRFDRRGNCVSSDTESFTARQTPGGLQMQPNDGYLLRVANLGGQSAYVAILSLTADGSVSQLFPHPASEMSDNVLEGDTVYTIDLCYTAEEPYGDEVLKLFATRDKIDFSSVLSSSGSTRGAGESSYLEQMMVDSYKGTRAGVSGKASGTGTTDAVTIKVVPQHK